jgi:hypothetical protein
MSRQQVREQAAELRRPGVTVRCVDDAENVVVILEPYVPPNGAAYKPAELTALAFLVPAGFPDACPDTTGFYVKPPGLRVAATDTVPQSTGGNTTLLGDTWMKFSWKPKTYQWDPTTDTLETHLATLEKRFLLGT